MAIVIGILPASATHIQHASILSILPRVMLLNYPSSPLDIAHLSILWEAEGGQESDSCAIRRIYDTEAAGQAVFYVGQGADGTQEPEGGKFFQAEAAAQCVELSSGFTLLEEYMECICLIAAPRGWTAETSKGCNRSS